jgi:hypothetical protein
VRGRLLGALLGVLLVASLVAATGCGSVTGTGHDGGGGAAGARDGGGGAAGAHGDASTGSNALRDRAADKDLGSAADAPRDRTSAPHDASSDGIVTGGECGGDSDCKQYSDGIGGCCGACIPATQPQPPTVECLLPCLMPIKSCTCVNHQCTGSTTLL